MQQEEQKAKRNKPWASYLILLNEKRLLQYLEYYDELEI
jgi:hypothetical protein